MSVVTQRCYRYGEVEIPWDAPEEALPLCMYSDGEDDVGVGAFSIPVLTSSKVADVDAWLRDAYNWSEEVKLASLTPTMETKVRAVLAELRAEGWEPRMFNGFRHPATQQSFYDRGDSKVTFSRHNGLRWDPRGYLLADAHATDITDPRFNEAKIGDRPSLALFYKALRDAAKRQGLGSGADYARWETLPDGSKRALSIWSEYGLGWDPVHIEDTSKSVKQLQKDTYAAIETAERAGAPQIYAGVPSGGGSMLGAIIGIAGLAIAGVAGAALLQRNRKK